MASKVQSSLFYLLPKLGLFLLCSNCFFPVSFVHAADRRLALLVANQEGWKKDPHLRYALSGDLHPFAKRLRKLGFQVITLENQSPQKLRQIFQKISKEYQVNTFLFYYSGHADKHFLHMGKRKKHPFSYREFKQVFSHLRIQRRIAIFDSCYSGSIIRQFGSLQRYQKLLKEGRSKGVRARNKLNIKRLLLPNQGKEEGIRIISSSLELSWELNRYKASVFTYHLLKGLDGRADSNLDGKISIDELFDFASHRVKVETGQKPEQLLLLKRSSPYAIAPAYHSQLWIGPEVKGHLQVNVANFLWKRVKKGTLPLHLSVVHGKGSIFLKKTNGCFKQSLLIPRGSKVKLPNKWSRISCKKVAQQSKGSLALQVQIHHLKDVSPDSQNLLFGIGYQQAGNAELRTSFLNLSIGFRLNRFFEFEFLYDQGRPATKQFSLSKTSILAKTGYSYLLRPKLELFSGLYGSLGFAFLHNSNRIDGPTITYSLGGFTALNYWFNNRFGLRINGSLGLDYLFSTAQKNHSFAWKLNSSFLFRL